MVGSRSELLFYFDVPTHKNGLWYAIYIGPQIRSYLNNTMGKFANILHAMDEKDGIGFANINFHNPISNH